MRWGRDQRTTDLKSTGQSGINPAFDFDDSGSVNNADFGQFRNRFLKTFFVSDRAAGSGRFP